MANRTLKSPPRLLPLYARAAAPLIPGASRLPFIPGGGKEIPQTELLLDDVRPRPSQVAAYAKVCGFTLREHLPITYPHVLAFPLHMALMADGSFPFGAVGLVHIENEILQRRPIAVEQPLHIRVFSTPLAPHPRGRVFTLLTEVSVDGAIVWEERSTMLRRGAGERGDQSAGSGERGAKQAGPGERKAADREHRLSPAGLRPSATWRLPGDLGRRYAAVSGDRNPIHMHPLSAKLFGFPGAIAHGMWSKARCLAALASHTPDACEAQVSFRKPIVLPAKVQFASSLSESRASPQPREISFCLTDPKKGMSHLEGVIRPSQQIERSEAK
jgi:acyl dehydratase